MTDARQLEREEPAVRRVRRVVDHYRSGIDPILAEHATWAADRLQYRARSGTDA